MDQVAAAARALGLRQGPIHAECRVNTKGVYVLEVAPVRSAACALAPCASTVRKGSQFPSKRC